MTTFLSSFRLRTIGFPLCQALPHAFEYFGEEVRCAEPFFAVLAALGKTDLFRTHEVTHASAPSCLKHCNFSNGAVQQAKTPSSSDFGDPIGLAISQPVETNLKGDPTFSGV